MTHTLIRTGVVAGAILLLSSIEAAATPVSLSFETSGSGFMGVAVDPATGKVYERHDYFTGQAIQVYNNRTDFEAHVISNNVFLAGGGYWGTYFAVNNGTLYGRDSSAFNGGWPADAQVSAWDLSTGAKVNGPVNIPGMGGENGYDGFNWGGFSDVNVMQDSTGLYVAGGNLADNNWQVAKIDGALNVTGSTAVGDTTGRSFGQEGYGFVINGVYFASTDYYSNNISIRVDLTTGLQTAVSYDLVGSAPLSPYWENVSYDYASDTLRFANVGDGVYIVENASVAFNAPGAETAAPAPGALALLGLGLIGVGGMRRKKVAA